MIRRGLCVLALVLAFPAGAAELFQYSLLNALFQGAYDGEITIARLARHGDFGLGTVNGLDGELVAVDGRFFRVGTDGLAMELPGETRSPFAMVTAFVATVEAKVPAGLDQRGLEAWLAQVLPPGNHPQAIRIDATFARLELRSVPRQARPYPGLVQALKSQVTFPRETVRGTVIGFRMPGYARGINAPGYHFHFLDAERQSGGHVLGLLTGDGIAGIADLEQLTLALPANADFTGADLGDTAAPGGANAVEGKK